MKTVKSISTAVISLDMGTSSARACLVDGSLRILFQRSVNVRLDSGLDGRAEQDAVLTCLTDVNNWATSKAIIPEGFCFSNSVSSLVILDEKDRPISPALTWVDTLAAHEADSLKNHLDVELYKRTACRSKVL
jgi:sugar (pentulose or hexulose) kinase